MAEDLGLRVYTEAIPKGYHLKGIYRTELVYGRNADSVAEITIHYRIDLHKNPMTLDVVALERWLALWQDNLIADKIERPSVEGIAVEVARRIVPVCKGWIKIEVNSHVRGARRLTAIVDRNEVRDEDHEW